MSTCDDWVKEKLETSASMNNLMKIKQNKQEYKQRWEDDNPRWWETVSNPDGDGEVAAGEDGTGTAGNRAEGKW